MFKNEFQGGTHVDIFSTHGKDPISQWKVHGPGIKKEYEKDVRSYVYQLEGSTSTTKIQLPKDLLKQTLALTQRFLVLQLYIPKSQEFSFEVGISDAGKNKRRLNFSTATRELSTTPLHAKIPLQIVKKAVWLNCCYDMASAVGETWRGQTFRTIDSLTISAYCRVRRIFTMKHQPPDTSGDDDFDASVTASIQSSVETSEESAIPKACQISPDVEHLTQVINIGKVRMAERKGKGLESMPQDIDLNASGRKINGNEPYVIAFGTKVAPPPGAVTSATKQRNTPSRDRRHASHNGDLGSSATESELAGGVEISSVSVASSLVVASGNEVISGALHGGALNPHPPLRDSSAGAGERGAAGRGRKPPRVRSGGKDRTRGSPPSHPPDILIAQSAPVTSLRTRQFSETSQHSNEDPNSPRVPHPHSLRPLPDRNNNTSPNHSPPSPPPGERWAVNTTLPSAADGPQSGTSAHRLAKYSGSEIIGRPITTSYLPSSYTGDRSRPPHRRYVSESVVVVSGMPGVTASLVGNANISKLEGVPSSNSGRVAAIEHSTRLTRASLHGGHTVSRLEGGGGAADVSNGDRNGKELGHVNAWESVGGGSIKSPSSGEERTDLSVTATHLKPVETKRGIHLGHVSFLPGNDGGSLRAKNHREEESIEGAGPSLHGDDTTDEIIQLLQDEAASEEIEGNHGTAQRLTDQRGLSDSSEALYQFSSRPKHVLTDSFYLHKNNISGNQSHGSALSAAGQSIHRARPPPLIPVSPSRPTNFPMADPLSHDVTGGNNASSALKQHQQRKVYQPHRYQHPQQRLQPLQHQHQVEHSPEHVERSHWVHIPSESSPETVNTGLVTMDTGNVASPENRTSQNLDTTMMPPPTRIPLLQGKRSRRKGDTSHDDSVTHPRGEESLSALATANRRSRPQAGKFRHGRKEELDMNYVEVSPTEASKTEDGAHNIKTSPADRKVELGYGFDSQSIAVSAGVSSPVPSPRKSSSMPLYSGIVPPLSDTNLSNQLNDITAADNDSFLDGSPIAAGTAVSTKTTAPISIPNGGASTAASDDTTAATSSSAPTYNASAPGPLSGPSSMSTFTPRPPESPRRGSPRPGSGRRAGVISSRSSSATSRPSSGQSSSSCAPSPSSSAGAVVLRAGGMAADRIPSPRQSVKGPRVSSATHRRSTAVAAATASQQPTAGVGDSIQPEKIGFMRQKPRDDDQRDMIGPVQSVSTDANESLSPYDSLEITASKAETIQKTLLRKITGGHSLRPSHQTSSSASPANQPLAPPTLSTPVVLPLAPPYLALAPPTLPLAPPTFPPHPFTPPTVAMLRVSEGDRVGSSLSSAASTRLSRKSVREIRLDEEQLNRAHDQSRGPYDSRRYTMHTSFDEAHMLSFLRKEQDSGTPPSLPGGGGGEGGPTGPGPGTPARAQKQKQRELHHQKYSHEIKDPSGSESDSEMSVATPYRAAAGGVPHSYQEEMQRHGQTNPRDGPDGGVFSPPIVIPSRRGAGPAGDPWHGVSGNDVRGQVKGSAGLNDETDSHRHHNGGGRHYCHSNTSESDSDEELDLIYDAELNCYFDPVTSKYYTLVP